MSREIKFRAWDKEEKSFFTIQPSINDCRRFDAGDMSLNDWFREIQEEFELLQCTGLKDKNGVEIYEGDIVKYHNEETCTIEWEETGARYYISNNEDNENEWCNGFDMSISRECEVIGNIYENPELLN